MASETLLSDRPHPLGYVGVYSGLGLKVPSQSWSEEQAQHSPNTHSGQLEATKRPEESGILPCVFSFQADTILLLGIEGPGSDAC